MSVKLIAITQGSGDLVGRSAQDITGYITRVSSPVNQEKYDTVPKLLAYCINNQHWSPFEHVYMTLEIVTSRAIAAQILRHRSFTFQEFSQRYASATAFETYPARRQDVKNRQNSIDDMSEEIKNWFLEKQEDLQRYCQELYEEALIMGIAKEQARFMLPLGTQTKLYMTGNARSWIHYCQLRTDISTQKEHRDIAIECKNVFNEQFPDIGKALEAV